ncbi:PTS sugar transporter subunit IIB [Olsenella sp. KGMB02461]|nr:PTS sugar transporter subunit IIB [Olsenella sp. KGMB02461]
MTNILLVCSAGMSTSMLVQKMEQEAKKRGLDTRIWAVADAKAAENVGEADVMLLGPQVRFMLDKMRALAGDTPVDVIDMRVYGAMNGAAALDQALALIGQ